METKYQTIKNSVRKGLAGAMLGVSLLGGASAYAAQKYSLPINQETTEVIQNNMQKESIARENEIKSNLQAYFQTYNQKAQEAKKVFNSALEDRVFTETEQRQVYSLLNDAKESVNSANKYAKENGINSKYQVSQSTNDLYKLVCSTSSTQQKILKDQGLSVKVAHNQMDKVVGNVAVAGVFGFFALIGVAGVAISCIPDKKKEK
jgi:Fe2+ transport system protein B